MTRIVNELYVTECITFPRCGHTWLSRILKYYFKNDLNYCEMYNNPELMIDVNENTNLQKNHDIHLYTPVKNDRKYIIQIRGAEQCLNSYYKLEVAGIDNNYVKKQIGSTDLINFQEYRRYNDWIEEKKIFYNHFLNKWVFKYIPNSKIVIYEHLKDNTVEEVLSIIKFMTDKDGDREKLLIAIENSNEPHLVNEPFKEKYIM